MKEVWNKESVLELLDEKSFDESINTNLTQKQKQEIRYNIWYKLFKLQNYRLSMNMFLGSTMRWTSIQTYLTMIREITQGKVDEYTTSAVYSPSLIKYIKGLLDSGEEPYPELEELGKQKGLVSIVSLLNCGVLTPREVQFIYSNVGVDDLEPDTSISTCRNVGQRKQSQKMLNTSYNKITLFDDVFKNINHTNPIKQSNISFGFNIKKSKEDMFTRFKNTFKFSV